MGKTKCEKGLVWVPTRVQLADGLTKSSARVFLGNALEESTKVLKTTHQQFEGKFGTSQWCKRILSRKIGGNEDITQESPAQDPSLPTAASVSTYNFPTKLVRICRQLLRYPRVHFTHVFSTRCRCTNVRVGSSSETNAKCQTSSSHVHPPSVHRCGSKNYIHCKVMSLACFGTPCAE